MKYTLENFGEAIDALMSRIDVLEQRLAAREKQEVFRKLATRKELCEYLGICELSAIRLEKKGTISSIKVGSAVRYDLQKVVKELQEAGELV